MSDKFTKEYTLDDINECNEICSAYWGAHYTCDKVTDNIFIVTRRFDGEQKEYYLPCIKKDGVIIRYTVAFDTFDQAVNAAYSYLSLKTKMLGIGLAN